MADGENAIPSSFHLFEEGGPGLSPPPRGKAEGGFPVLPFPARTPPPRKPTLRLSKKKNVFLRFHSEI